MTLTTTMSKHLG